jgi:hypothetical protein
LFELPACGWAKGQAEGESVLQNKQEEEKRPFESGMTKFLGLMNNLDTARRNLGLSSGVTEAITCYLAGMRFCGEGGAATLERILKIAHADWRKATDGIRVIEAPSAHVTYVMPTYEELKMQFPKYVCEEYDGIVFTPIVERIKTAREARRLPFRYVTFDGRLDDAERVIGMIRHGMLPALPEEAVSLLKEHPQEMKKSTRMWTIGAYERDERVMVVWCDEDGKTDLNLDQVNRGWKDRDPEVYLAIPIEALDPNFQVAA